MRIMGEYLRVRNLKICVLPKDHRPPHVHVFGPGAEAKFTIGDFVCYYSRGFKRSAINELTEFLKKNEDPFMGGVE